QQQSGAIGPDLGVAALAAPEDHALAVPRERPGGSGGERFARVVALDVPHASWLTKRQDVHAVTAEPGPLLAARLDGPHQLACLPVRHASRPLPGPRQQSLAVGGELGAVELPAVAFGRLGGELADDLAIRVAQVRRAVLETEDEELLAIRREDRREVRP